MRFLWIALVAGGLYVPAFAQVYKWVDEKGVTQYGQRSPADNRGQKMQLPPASPPGGAVTTAPRDPLAKLRDQELELKKRQIAREETQQKDFKQESARKQWCIGAKDDLERKRHARIYELNDKGERVFMNDADRDASVARFEATYKQHCQ